MDLEYDREVFAMAIFRQASRKIVSAAPSLSAAFREAAPSLSLVRHYADEGSLLKTPLYDFHVEQGGELASLKPLKESERNLPVDLASQCRSRVSDPSSSGLLFIA